MATLSANTQYEYTNEILGSYSGGTWEASLGNAPHPEDWSPNSDLNYTGNTVVQLNSIKLGGIDGLNN
jgi:hypothetical protein